MIRVADVVEFFLRHAEWVKREETVDRVIVGDPEAEVDRCLVTWIANMQAVRQAVERGFRLLITHEPTFYTHWDERAGDDAQVQEKLAYVEDSGLTIVRLHDSWDRWPDVGIPWAWARFLGFAQAPDAISESRYQHRYDMEPMALEAFARQVAEHCAVIWEDQVQVTGNPQQWVGRIGVGTGCACSIATFVDMGCDCSIVCDDGSCYWGPIQRAEDMGHPVIRVNHGTSEEPGMATLTQYINDHVDGLAAEHLPHGSTFRLIGA